jgi:hypothetical protein
MSGLKIAGRSLTILITGAVLTGCAYFRNNELPELAAVPRAPADVKKMDAYVELAAEMDLGVRRKVIENARSRFEGELVRVLRRTGYFADIDRSPDGEGMGIKVHLLNEGNPAALPFAVLTGATFYCLPSWAKENYTVECKVKTADGKEYTYELQDSGTLVQWLPMAFVFPFKNLGEAEKLRMNMYKHLIQRMQKDGILPKPDAPLETSSLIIILDVREA